MRIVEFSTSTHVILSKCSFRYSHGGMDSECLCTLRWDDDGGHDGKCTRHDRMSNTWYLRQYNAQCCLTLVDFVVTTMKSVRFVCVAPVKEKKHRRCVFSTPIWLRRKTQHIYCIRALLAHSTVVYAIECYSATMYSIVRHVHEPYAKLRCGIFSMFVQRIYII